jgi:site-specific DNA recombinase
MTEGDRASQVPGRAVIYARVSLDQGSEPGSIERQVEACKKLADFRGWDVVSVLEDRSVSAYTGARRPGWEKVLGLIEAGQVDVLISWHVDRMTRSLPDLERLIILAEDRAVGIATATGDIDLTTDTGRMVARILAAVARAEVERKGERQRLANEQEAREGRPHRGGVRPFGYEADGMTIVPEEADALRLAAMSVLSGASVYSIAKGWSAQGLVSSRPSSQGWTSAGVRGVLLNPRNAGMRVYKGEVVGPGVWPAILDLQVHHELVAALSNVRRQDFRRGPGRRPTTLLGGLARCAVCGGTLRGSANAQKALRYTCPDNYCLLVPRDVLDDHVGEWVISTVTQPAVSRRLTVSGDANRDDARIELATVRGRLDQLARAFATGSIDLEQLNAGSSALLDVEAKAAALVAGPWPSQSAVGEREVRSRWASLSLEDRRRVVAALCEIRVQPHGRVHVRAYDPALRVSVSLRRGTG